jgi:hypothetical protein|tara:strand:- start:24 stop:242 length:219 start_codon:yes stop_codon:yes gene_type:complete
MDQNLNVDINQTTPVLCEECNENLFEQAVIIRKASGILTGTGKTGYVPIPVFSCKGCGHVNVEFLPKEAQSF